MTTNKPLQRKRGSRDAPEINQKPPVKSRRTLTGERAAREEEIDCFAQLTKNIGYQFIDTEHEMIDVDAWYGDYAQTKPLKKAHNQPKIPELKSVQAPPNKKAVRMVIDGELLEIHTWYPRDFRHLAAFGAKFEQGGAHKEDMVAKVSRDAFEKLPAEDLSKFFGQKHILVTGCVSVTSVEDLERHLLMKREIDIQGKLTQFIAAANIAAHCRGTLQQMKNMIESGDDDEKQRPLNALDLPCGHVALEIPRLRDMSFRDVVWSYLKHVDRPLYQESIPMDDFKWAAYSSRNAYSTPHVDANGFCTAIAPVNCRKLWILGRPLNESLLDSRAFSTFRMYDIDLDDYEWAPLLIEPGDILYMRPGTVHAVVTIDPGFTVGEHFYTMATLEHSLVSLFHLCAADAILTNASHDVAVVKMLTRLLHCWCHAALRQVDVDDVPSFHCTDPSHIKCLVMVGAYLHVFPYVQDVGIGLSPIDMQQLAQAQQDYNILHNFLVQHFDLKNISYGPYSFPHNAANGVWDSEFDSMGGGDAADRKYHEKKIYNMVFRNGEMWILAHLVEFYAHARKLVDDEETDGRAARLHELINLLVRQAGLDQAWFDECHKWIKSNFRKYRLDDWLNWGELEIVPRVSF